MLKKSITYTDMNGEERTETFYFHLSKADLIRLEAGKQGLQQYLEGIQRARNVGEVVKFMEELIDMTYGERSPDGSRFIKTTEILQQFKSSEAYSEFLMELCTDADNVAAFIRGIVPAGTESQVDQAIAKAQAAQGRSGTSDTTRNVFEREEPIPTESLKHPPEGALADKSAGRVLNEAEIREMDPVDLQRGLLEGRYLLPKLS